MVQYWMSTRMGHDLSGDYKVTIDQLVQAGIKGPIFKHCNPPVSMDDDASC